MKKITLYLIVCFLLSLSLYAQPSVGTTTFDGPNISIAGFDLLPRSGPPVDGWNFSIQGSGAATGSITHGGAATPSYVVVFGSSGTSNINIASSDGSEFNLDNYSAQFFNFTGTYTVTAYRDGVSVGSTTASAVAGGGYSIVNFTANTAFDNIDEIRLTGFGSSSVTFLIDEITISAATTVSLPNVTTTAATSISGISATLGGDVTDDGGASVTARGVVYSSTDTTPEIGEANVTQDSNGNGTSSFNEIISGLSIGTTYYVQAYAINSEGTSYGGVQSFTTLTCDVSFSYSAAAYCVDASDPTPTVTGLTGGTFSSTAGLSINASSGAIDVSASTPGTYTVTYTTAGTCPNSSNVSVTINALDDASFSYAAAAYCVDASDPTPTVTGLTGGSFTSTAGLSLNASTGAIDVSASTPGTYTVTYTTAGTCPNSSNVSVTINALDDASFSYAAAAYCVDASDPTPTVTGLTGGSFTSTAGLSLIASTGAIDVSASTPGTYTVTYTTAGTCPNSSNVSVTINALDDASFSYAAAAYCVDASDPTPTVTGLTGGSFTSTAGLSLNASTGAIDVSASTPGTYTVTYTTAGTCPNSSNVSVTINALDDASFSYSAAAYCVDASDPTPTVTGLTGGTFSSTAGLSLNASSGAIDVSASTPGTYTVTYTTAGTCPNSSNVSVTINALDDASFGYSAAAFCVSDADPTATVTGLTGGSFTSTAGLSLNASTGAIDVSASTPGTYTVTYTTAGTCPNSSNQSVTINALDNASFSYAAAAYCVDASDPTPTVTGLTGGSFSSTTGLSLNASTGAIDVSASTPGTYTVTYTTAGTCPNSSNVSVTINALDNASFSYAAAAYCVDASDPTPTVTGLTGGSFSSTAGLSLNASSGAIDVSASTPGTYTVTYTTAGTCPNSSNVSLTINALDDASFSYAENEYSVESDDPTPTIIGLAGGSFTSAAGLVIDASSGIIDVSASAPGTYTVSYTTNGTCSNTSNFEITILDCTLSASAVATNVTCGTDTDGSIDLTVNGGTLPYTFAWDNSATTEDLTGLAVGIYEVTVTDARNCSVIISVEVEAVDNVDPVISCFSDQTITLSSGQTTYTVPDFVESGDVTATDNCDGSVSNITQSPVAGTNLSQGVHEITFIATDLSGNTDECIVQITVEGTLGVDDVSLSKLSLYPNPVGDILSIKLPEFVELDAMIIYDLTGKEVMNINLKRNQEQIDVSNLQSAQYLVSIRSKKGAKIIRRLLKK